MSWIQWYICGYLVFLFITLHILSKRVTKVQFRYVLIVNLIYPLGLLAFIINFCVTFCASFKKGFTGAVNRNKDDG